MKKKFCKQAEKKKDSITSRYVPEWRLVLRLSSGGLGGGRKRFCVAFCEPRLLDSVLYWFYSFTLWNWKKLIYLNLSQISSLTKVHRIDELNSITVSRFFLISRRNSNFFWSKLTEKKRFPLGVSSIYKRRVIFLLIIIVTI